MTQVRHQNQIGLYRGRCQPEGITQKRLAELMDTSPRTIQAWEEKGVAKVSNLLGLVEMFVTHGAITNYEEAKEFWKRGSQREGEWEAPNKLAALFQHPPEPNALPQAEPVAEQGAIVSEVPWKTALIDPAATALLQPISVAVPAEATLVHPRSFYRHRPRVVLMTVLLVMLIAITFIVLRPTKTQAVAPRSSIPFVTNGQLAPAFTFRRGGSFYSGTTVDEATNTLTLIAGPDTDQHTTDIYAPVVTLPVHGDFDVSVHLTTKFPNTQCCQHAGIGVRSPADPSVWIRITRDHARVLTVNRNRGEVELPTHRVDAGTSLDLRIQRTGNQFSFFYREVGDEWIPFTVPLSFELPQDAELYLVVYSAHNNQNSTGAFRNLVIR